jgi:kynureninase
MQNVTENEWGERLIRGWNDGWIHISTDLGTKIAPLIGAQSDEVLVTDATSINIFKLAVAALQARPNRKKIVSDVFNFPSDVYILQGIIDLLGNSPKQAHITAAWTTILNSWKLSGFRLVEPTRAYSSERTNVIRAALAFGGLM